LRQQKTKKMRVVPVRDNHVYPVSKTPKGYEVLPETTIELSNRERHKVLIESFGSKKKQRAVKSAEANLIQTENIADLKAVHSRSVKGKEEQKAEEARVLGAAQQALEQSRQEMLPPFNPEATQPNEVFKLNEIIQKKEWAVLNQEFDQFVVDGDNPEVAVPNWVQRLSEGRKFPSFIMSKLQAVGDPMRARKHVCRLLYLRHMMIIALAGDRIMSSSEDFANANGIPPTIAFQLLRQFWTRRRTAQEESHSRTKTQQDRMMLFILALVLVVSNYGMRINDVAGDLQLDPKRVGGYFRQLGAQVLNSQKARKMHERGEQDVPLVADGELVALLRIPLDFEIHRKKAGPKRR
jgi:hypothetical protein